MAFQEVFVEPALFLSHNGVKVYHTYKNDHLEEGMKTYHFTTSIEDGDDTNAEFDARDIFNQLRCPESVGSVGQQAFAEVLAAYREPVMRGDWAAIEGILRVAINFGIIANNEEESDDADQS